MPKGKDRVRVCLHAGNTWAEVDRLVEAIMEWAGEMMAQIKGEVRKSRKEEVEEAEGAVRAVRLSLESKL